MSVSLQYYHSHRVGSLRSLSYCAGTNTERKKNVELGILHTEAVIIVIIFVMIMINVILKIIIIISVSASPVRTALYPYCWMIMLLRITGSAEILTLQFSFLIVLGPFRRDSVLSEKES